MKRREFVGLVGSAATSTLIMPTVLQSCMGNMNMGMGGNIPVEDGGYDVALPLPSVIDTSSVHLISKSSSFGILKGKTTTTLTYGNGILGPTIKANSGDSLNVQLQNNLTEATNIHWHGLHLPSSMDGHPKDLAQSGVSINYVLNINQRAGTYWYHPHPDKKTARQVSMGLGGMFIVNDNEEASLNLPSGEAEVPLIIQDKRISGDQLNYAPTIMDVMNGYLGESILVNGVYSPFLNVTSRWYRFRVLNGSTARVYLLALTGDRDFYIIGNDGGLLTSPEKVKTAFLAPGERLDLLIDFSGLSVGKEVFLQSNSFSGRVQGSQQFRIVKFVVNSAVTDSFILPNTLSSIIATPSSSSARTRTFDIGIMGMGGGMGMAGMHTINGKTFGMDRIDETVQAGSTEIWELNNSKGDEIHPMHIHGLHFQVIERTGGRAGLMPFEKGWKDTVMVMAGEKVKVIMTFPQNKGLFVFHCHNLEHEDDGMMMNYEIV